MFRSSVRWVAATVFVSLALGLCSAVDAQPLGTGSQEFNQRVTPTVPNVVGMSLPDAEKAIADARLGYTWNEEREPNTSVLMGHVRSTNPVAGTRVPAGGTVRLNIPRAAVLVGIGSLSAVDGDRRDGFDLDEGVFQQITHGADVTILPKYHEWDAWYPSDGASIARDDLEGAWREELGSFSNYLICERLFSHPYNIKPSIAVYSAGIFCVKTSKSQMAIVRVMHDATASDPTAHHSDFRFDFALFPNPRPFVALGRVQAQPGAAPRPPVTICEAARSARARGSPAAPGLERQCQAAGGQ